MLLLVCVSVFCFFSCKNVLYMWIFLELVSLLVLFYVILLGLRDVNLVGVVIYFLLQALGGVMFVMGIMFDFCVYGNLVSVLSPVSYVCLFFMVLGLLLKMGIYPFYFWVARVYVLMEGKQCFYVGVYSKIIPLLLFFFASGVLGMGFLFFLAMFSVVLSGVLGVFMTDVRGLMGLSSVGHSGWFLVSMLGGIIMFFFYFCFYAFFNYLVFFGMSFRGVNVFFNFGRGQTGGWGLKLLVFLVFFSIGGFAPSLGFFLKVFLMGSVLSIWGFLYCVLFLLLGGGVVFFYCRVLQFLFSVNSNYGVLRVGVNKDVFCGLWVVILFVFLLFFLVFFYV
uniref:NADH-ubiquinone oxidoreductase chain 2 n=1 Tax=Halocynthia spinosa TaxID=569430 RepID=S0DFE4_HALSF|nr:NADH dehydrogenase subunit 2 [Halocynthia spinosa]CCO25776.1 NADH dehydrogenase subunit 2 [Halocynthia spinosa]